MKTNHQATIMLNKYNIDNLGFTLIELLIAMAITGIVSAGIFSAYHSQQNAQLAQKQIVEMQQNLRAALYIMTSDIRMAGYDPDGTHSAGLTKIGDGSNGQPLGFTFVELADSDGIDNDGDGTIDEPGELKLQTVEYDLYDAYGDGDSDIGRKQGAASRQAIAENIMQPSAVAPVVAPLFQYLDSNQNITTNISDVRAIRISLTATTDQNEIDYTKGNNRRTLTTIVKCRNLGLQH